MLIIKVTVGQFTSALWAMLKIVILLITLHLIRVVQFYLMIPVMWQTVILLIMLLIGTVVQSGLVAMPM